MRACRQRGVARGRWRRLGALPAGAWLAAALLGALAGCGGGGGAPSLALTVPADFATSADRTNLSGTLSLPQGSERLGGTPSLTFQTCQLGAYSLVWANAATGASGAGHALWDCPDEHAHWSASGIALAPGANRITLTAADGAASAQAVVTVTRQ